MLRWFITGGGGQLATAFAERLTGEVFLSREETLDIRNAAAVAAAIHSFAPHVVLHTAAFTDVDGAEATSAAAEVNVDGTRNIVNAVRGSSTAVISFSTDYVFDGTKGAPYVESDAPRPLNAYGRTKLLSEEIVLSWAHGTVIRTSWLFSETGRNFVKTILAAGRQKAAAGEPLRVVDDQVGSPTYAGHLAAGVEEAVLGDLAPGLYHMAGGGWCSWRTFAAQILHDAGIAAEVLPITTAELGRPAARPAFSALISERGAPQLPHWREGTALAVQALTKDDRRPPHTEETHP